MFAIRKYSILLLITSVIITTSLLIPLTNADTKAYVLSTSGDGKGYAGGSGTITLGVKVMGVTAYVSIHIDGVNAYDALAAAIGGIYDDAVHKWVAFGGSSVVTSKDYKTLAEDEWYNFKLASYVPCNIKYSNEGMFIRLYCKSTATFDVKHCVRYGTACYEWLDYLVAYPNALVPKDALSSGSNIGISH